MSTKNATSQTKTPVKTLTGHKAGYIAAIKAAATIPSGLISYVHGTGFAAHGPDEPPVGAVWTRAYFERGAIEPIMERSYGLYRGRILDRLNAAIDEARRAQLAPHSPADLVAELHRRGCAVMYYTPQELGRVDPGDFEDAVEETWCDALETLRD